MIKESNPAAALARMRKGIKEQPSEAKRQAARANLERARQRWSNIPHNQRCRKSPQNRAILKTTPQSLPETS